MMKNYLLNLLQQCSEEKFGQDAIEWAITSGRIRLTYDLECDIRVTMSKYDEIIERYRESLARTTTVPQHAPMQRAAPRNRLKARDATSSSKRKKAA